jgi:uncharacterized protein (TIGR02145 family)
MRLFKGIFHIAGLVVLLFFAACDPEEEDPTQVTDIDGNVYPAVRLGSQIWMGKNLATTRYCNGDSITYIDHGRDWVAADYGAYAKYYKSDSLAAIYGYLYNWYAVGDDRGICPCGWHVPEYDEWMELINYLGGDSLAGGKMKEEGNAHWQNNTGASNSIGLCMLPGGYRSEANGATNSMGLIGYWWTATLIDSIAAFSIRIRYYDSYAYRLDVRKACGQSIRCVKD